MRIERGARRRRPLSLTSLIDVIFLLLLFFMLSSTFSRFSEIELQGGRAGPSASAAAPGILVRIDEAGGWNINGEATAPGEVEARLERFAGLGAEAITLLPRSGVSTQQLVDALEHLRRVTALPVNIAR
ncbi:biopolymer transporter ExbD [Pelagibacterium sp. H642]|uniref:biopolymer transporter ExbD n=1 Tax=Pelagibacterium sp. H642 TaxID=1881069 RepID=UPI002815CE22|nr:biopolymer transporter ExbD [Pelagibacterium sp. H642]WMT91276.1 biopolymer transporter ExbD [Pelagibacterium sp. H642]